MTDSPSQSEKLVGYGVLLIGVAAFACVVVLLRRLFPDAFPWHLLRGSRPPVQPWQFWTFIGGIFFMGLRMVALGRAQPSSTQDAGRR